MWFASIWIFTLRLPWRVGADFFYRHLLDGDAASNTLGWRWVAGLHTRGKPYPADAQNIATFTAGRFTPRPADLAEVTEGLEATEPDGLPPVLPLRPVTAPRPGLPTALLITDEDCRIEDFGLSLDIRTTATLSPATCVPLASVGQRPALRGGGAGGRGSPRGWYCGGPARRRSGPPCPLGGLGRGKADRNGPMSRRGRYATGWTPQRRTGGAGHHAVRMATRLGPQDMAPCHRGFLQGEATDPAPAGRRDFRMTDLPRENVQSYPRPPRVEPVPQRIRVVLGGATVARRAAPCGCWKRTMRRPTTCHPQTCRPPCARPRGQASANGRASRAISM